MDFPATRPQAAPLPPEAAKVLAVPGPVTCVGSTAMNLTLVLPDESQVRACNPDLGILAGWHRTGVIVTAAAMTPGIDFVSRFFAPQSGVPEDPVTGSAHCALAVYWADQLGSRHFWRDNCRPAAGNSGFTFSAIELNYAAMPRQRWRENCFCNSGPVSASVYCPAYECKS